MATDSAAHSANFKVMWDNQRFAKATSRIEGVTGVFAQHLIVQAGLRDYPTKSDLVVFDRACGGGIFTLKLQAILQDRPQNSFNVTCGDLADAMVGLTQQRIEEEGWTNTTVKLIDAEDTGLPSAQFTHVFTNFGFMAFAEPSKALQECYRMLRPGGVCAFTTWGSVPWLDQMKAAMASVPGLPKLPEDMNVPNIFSKEKIWDDVEAVRNFTVQHRFIEVESKMMAATSVLTDPAELVQIIKPPLTLMTRFFWTQEQRDELDNNATHSKIFAWFENKLKDGPMEWQWTAIVTTSQKPT